MSVVRVHARLAQIVGRLKNPLPNQGGIPVTKLLHEQRRQARGMRGREARADALVEARAGRRFGAHWRDATRRWTRAARRGQTRHPDSRVGRSEEHTSELQSLTNL